MVDDVVHTRGLIVPNYAHIDRDETIPFWRELVEEVHDADCKYLIQLAFSGRQRDIGGIVYEKGWSSTDKPEPIHPPDIAGLMARLKDAEQTGDLDRVNAIKAHLWLDGPLQPEGRVTGEARRLFLDMNAIALRSPPIGSNLDVAPTFHRLGEISAPSLVIWGDLDFPHIQERCRHVAATMPNGSGHMLTGMAHLPSLERPTEITNLLAEFIDGCSDRRA